MDVIVRKRLEKLLGSDVLRLCQPDEPWQEKGTNGETGRIMLEDNPVWCAEDQKSWFANFCIALKWPWNDTMDCKQRRTCRQRRGPAVGGCAGCKVHTHTFMLTFRLMIKLLLIWPNMKTEWWELCFPSGSNRDGDVSDWAHLHHLVVREEIARCLHITAVKQKPRWKTWRST